MRKVLIAGVLALVAACGQPAATGGGDAQAAAAPGGVEDQAAFVARCTRETIASNPESRNWAAGACEQTWEKVLAAGPLAEAVLAAAPASAGTVDLAAVPGRVTQVRWQGQSGRLNDLAVALTRAPPVLTFDWDAGGDIVPYDLEQALRGRGATLDLVGCQSYGGPFDVVRMYRVTVPGKAPFGLSVYAHDAAVAGAHAPFNAIVDLSGAPPTLARLRAQPNTEWQATCPS